MGVLGLSLGDFLELTPIELAKILEKHNEDRLKYFELEQIAIYSGFGQANSGKKFKSVFKNEQKNKAQARRVSDEEKLQDLQFIQQRLGRGDG